ncbi:hypothetical protein [Neobacillus jeddahensis]|uniref:hypothetical protein n=1 Tax=Neobacillus jeddahensis TaxID=1461580 RepID=UPI00058C2A39|nr:hypothetical protein [Neobacillus jeddahensis]
MTKPKVMSITYSEEMPEESAIILYRLIEKLILESLPLDPHIIGLFIEESMDEFYLKTNNRKGKTNDNKYYYEKNYSKL